MYGQPALPRPALHKAADERFIREAAAGFGGDRKAASKGWASEGDRYMNEGNLDFAMRRYNQAWLLDPDNHQAYWGFGRVLLERDQMDEAITHFERARALCNDHCDKAALVTDLATAFSYKAAAARARDAAAAASAFGSANARFAEATTLDATYGQGWLRWSHSLYREGDYAGAWEKLDKARATGAKITDVFVTNLTDKMPRPR